MYSRNFELQDLEECLGISSPRMGHELVGYGRAVSAWGALTKSEAFRAVTIGSSTPVAGHRIVAFGASVFVAPEFATGEISNPQPGLNGRIIASIASGRSVVLSAGDLRQQNTVGGLCQVILFATWRRDCLSPAQIDEIRVNLTKNYVELHSGYRLERVLFEAADAIDLAEVKRSPAG